MQSQNLQPKVKQFFMQFSKKILNCEFNLYISYFTVDQLNLPTSSESSKTKHLVPTEMTAEIKGKNYFNLFKFK